MAVEIKIKKGPGRVDMQRWQPAIEEAHAEMVSRLNRLWDELEVIFHQAGRGRQLRRNRVTAWGLNPVFVRYLGERITNEEIIDVRRRVRKLLRKANRRLIYVIVTTQTGRGSHWCIENTLAYVVPTVEGRKIHLCPQWIDADAEQRWSTLVHELVHKLGVFGRPHFGATTALEAIDLAERRPNKARMSPENYQHLVRALAPAESVEVVTLEA